MRKILKETVAINLYLFAVLKTILYGIKDGVIMGVVYKLVLTVKEIRGTCPVHKLGDRIVVDSPKINTTETDALCVHALGSMLSVLVPLARGISFKGMGLSAEEGNVGYVQCLDPGPPYTPGGTVIFKIERKPAR